MTEISAENITDNEEGERVWAAAQGAIISAAISALSMLLKDKQYHDIVSEINQQYAGDIVLAGDMQPHQRAAVIASQHEVNSGQLPAPLEGTQIETTAYLVLDATEALISVLSFEMAPLSEKDPDMLVFSNAMTLIKQQPIPTTVKGEVETLLYTALDYAATPEKMADTPFNEAVENTKQEQQRGGRSA